jgi:hypothetical protein
MQDYKSFVLSEIANIDQTLIFVIPQSLWSSDREISQADYGQAPYKRWGRLSLISSIREELVATLSKEGKRLLYTLRSRRHFGYSRATSYGGHSQVYSAVSLCK